MADTPKKKTTAKKVTAKKPVAQKSAAKKVATKKPTAQKKPAAKKATTKTAAKAATAKQATKQVAAKKKPLASSASPDALHYDKKALLAEYAGTFDLMMKATVISIGAVLLYFFIMVTFLGGFSHEKTNSFAEKFSDRIDLGSGYDGLKLPMYQTEE